MTRTIAFDHFVAFNPVTGVKIIKLLPECYNLREDLLALVSLLCILKQKLSESK